MTGANLMEAIAEFAALHGWRRAHFRPGRTKDGWRTPVKYEAKGWPDLTLVRDRVVWIEVKGDGDSLRPEQRDWIAALEDAGQEVYVATPRMWLDGELDPVLRRKL